MLPYYSITIYLKYMVSLEIPYNTTIRRFTVELSPNNPEPKHTPDSFFFICTTLIVEELHKNSELNHEATFYCRKRTNFCVKIQHTLTYIREKYYYARFKFFKI